MPWTEVLDSDDVDDARAQVARSYCPHSLTVHGRGGGFRARHAAADGPDVGVFRLGYGADPVRVRPVPFRDFVLVSRPLTGSLAVGDTPAAGPGEPVLLDAAGPHDLRFGAGARLLTVKVSVAALRRTGSAPPATGHPVDRRAWDAVTRFLAREAVPHGLLDAGSPLRRHTADLVASAVGACFAPGAPASPAGTAALDRACGFVAEHAGDDIGLAEIAAAAGVGPRTLQETFRRRLGTTPLGHLRDVRLDRARTDLRSGDRPVAEIAHRWGFTHLGRFASAYRARFGVLPSGDRARGRDARPADIRATRLAPGGVEALGWAIHPDPRRHPR